MQLGTETRGLVALKERVDADLNAIRYPDRTWVIPREGPGGAHVYDVVIIGAGQGGLGAAFGLLRKRVNNIKVFEANPPGRQGPWLTYGRMPTLRSPKHFNGPDLDVPSLTCESWYKAKYGEEAWHHIDQVSVEDWQEYLLWFKQVLEIPVRYGTRVTYVEPLAEELFEVQLRTESGEELVYANKVVFANGAEGSGGWNVPDLVQENLPTDFYATVADYIDFSKLSDCRVAVLGGGASAYDNAATALENGARCVDLFFRRNYLHRVNPHKWTEFAGFLDHMRDLGDEWRWRFMRYVLPMNEPPPPNTFKRAAQHDNFLLHLGEQWKDLSLTPDREVRIETPVGTYSVDFVLVATGLVQDLSLRPEVVSFEREIAKWKDVYVPPSEEQHEGLGKFPYLGPHFEYVEKTPGAAPFLRNIHNFTAAATVSHGPSGSSINGMKHGLQRLTQGITRDFFLRDVEEYYKDLLCFDTPELDVPWPDLKDV